MPRLTSRKSSPEKPHRRKKKSAVEGWSIVPPVKSKFKIYEPPSPPPYTVEQTLRWFKHARQDKWWQTQQKIRYRVLSKVLGLAERTVEHCITGHRFRRGVCIRLSLLIDKINRREIIFLRPDMRQCGVDKNRPHYVMLDSCNPVRIGKFVEEKFWNLYATCINCNE